MFDAIDNYARSIATKLSNWVLNLPFWPEGAVGERRLRYILLGLLASDQVLIFLSNWSLPGIAVFWYGKSDSSAVVARGDYLEVNSPRGNKYIFGLNYNRVVTTLKRYCSPEAQRINVNLSLENYIAAVLYRAPSSKLVFNNCFGSAVKRIK